MKITRALNSSFDFDKWYDRLKSVPALIISNKWSYLMGKIGSTSASFRTCRPADRNGKYDSIASVGREGWEVYFNYGPAKPLGELPKWRPIAYENNQYYESWDEILNLISDTDNQSIFIWKHPRQ